MTNRESKKLMLRTQRMDGVMNTLSSLGTIRDIGQSGRPTLHRRLGPDELDILVLTSDLARTIVSEKVNDAISSGWTVRNADTKEELETSDDPMQARVANAVGEAQIQANGQGGALVWIIEDSTDYATPLDVESFTKPEDFNLRNLVVLDRWEVSPIEWEDDPREPGFDDPVLYMVHPSRSGGQPIETTNAFPQVHKSRVLRFDGARLPRRLRNNNSGWHDSILQAPWDAIRRFEETENATATIVQRFETSVFSIANLQAALEDGQGFELIRKRLQLVAESMSILQAALIDIDAGESYTRQFANVQGLDTIWDRLAHSVAKAARMPMTQLFGMSPSGQATDDESGRANWRKQVAAYQKVVLRPLLEYLYRLIYGVEVRIEFNPVDELTTTEKATVLSTIAQTYRVFLEHGAIVSEEARVFLAKEGLIDPDANFEELMAKDLERKVTSMQALAPPEPVDDGEVDDGGNEPPVDDE